MTPWISGGDSFRIVVTHRCNLRCCYCPSMRAPARRLRPDALGPENFSRVSEAVAKLGFRNILLSGGEPLIRPDILEIADGVAEGGRFETLSLATNGIELVRYAPALYRAGVNRLDVSLASVDGFRYAAVMGRRALSSVMQGLDSAKRAGFESIRIVMPVIGGANHQDVEAMALFAGTRGFALRLIESGPGDEYGAQGGTVSATELRKRLGERFGLEERTDADGLSEPSRFFDIDFVSPRIEDARLITLMADGRLVRGPVSTEVFDLSPMLRSGADAASMAHSMRSFIESGDNKPKGRAILRNHACITAIDGG